GEVTPRHPRRPEAGRPESRPPPGDRTAEEPDHMSASSLLNRIDERVTGLGVAVLSFGAAAAGFTRFAVSLLAGIPGALRHPRAVREHMVWIGVTSLPLV